MSWPSRNMVGATKAREREERAQGSLIEREGWQWREWLARELMHVLLCVECSFNEAPTPFYVGALEEVETSLLASPRWCDRVRAEGFLFESYEELEFYILGLSDTVWVIHRGLYHGTCGRYDTVSWSAGCFRGVVVSDIG